MTTTELIELLKKHERGGATGRPREVMFEVDDRIINTDGIEVTGSGDGLISELYLSLPSAQPEVLACGEGELSAQPEIIRCKDCRHGVDYYHEGDCYCSNPKWGLKYFGGSWEFYCADAERRTDE